MSNNVLLAHPGTQYSHQLAKQLARHEALYEFWTGFAVATDSSLFRLCHDYLPQRLKRRLANRLLSGVSSKQLRTMPLVERRALKQLGRGQSSQRVFLERNRIFQQKIPGSSLQKASAVIGFDTSSWALAKRSEELGKPFFLDQSISHPLANQIIMQEVARAYPNWQSTIEMRLPELLTCEEQEYRLATRIVAASSFTKKTLVAHGVSAEKIVVNPYGVDLQLFHPPEKKSEGRPLRFIFLGAVSARKGVPLLLDAWQKVAAKEAELWLVGPITNRERALIPALPGLKVLGQYPRRELPELLRQCDVLVFPSYCEGFALVLLEALASGMPIITTDATAGPDLITDGLEGRIIPTGDLDALCETMEQFVRQPDKAHSMSGAARRCAERFSWDSYGDRWRDILQGLN